MLDDTLQRMQIVSNNINDLIGDVSKFSDLSDRLNIINIFRDEHINDYAVKLQNLKIILQQYG